MTNAERLAQYEPPKVPGRTCLQKAFGGNWHTAEGVARSLGYEITAVGGPSTWYYVDSDAVGDVLAVFGRWAADHQSATTVTGEHVSCKILDKWLKFSSQRFAELSGVPRKERNGDLFILTSDVAMVVAAAARGEQGIGWKTGPDDAAKCVAWIERHNLAGVTDAVARRERRLPSGW